MRRSAFLWLAPSIVISLACSGLGSPTPSSGGLASKPFDAQGHRGARGLLPENTLPAFERALELGVTTLELDLGVTRDHEVVVSHDRRINPRICQRSDGTTLLTPALLRELSRVEVQTLDCGSLNPDPKRFPEPPRVNLPGTRIPTLREVFQLAADFGDDQVRFNVETKIDPRVDDTVPIEDFVSLVVDVIREHGLQSRVTIQSFHWRALELTKRRAPEIETVALLASNTQTPEWLNGIDPATVGTTSLNLLRAARAYVDVYSPEWRLIVPGDSAYLGSSVAEIQAAGFPVIPWTVNSKRHMGKMVDLGVDGLISDYPDVLIGLLKERGIPIL